MRKTIAILFALGFFLSQGSAQAFDTGPHADMTRDALTAEGFGRAGADVGMVNNWFVDYYTNPDDNPYSGHAHALIGLTRFGFNREDWLPQWVEGGGGCTSTPSAARSGCRTCRRPPASSRSGSG